MTGKWLTINRGNQHSLRKLVILWLVSWRLIGHLLEDPPFFYKTFFGARVAAEKEDSYLVITHRSFLKRFCEWIGG